LPDITRQEFSDLLAFRTALRGFLQWSERAARDAGLTPAQHQLLLSIKGHTGDRPPTISDISDHLLLRHHSAVELIDRAQRCELVERWPDPEDGRIVRIRLTSTGERRLDELTALHRAEIKLHALVVRYLDITEMARITSVQGYSQAG
jgi:DNA-binding MarR family transcriptional regulator